MIFTRSTMGIQIFFFLIVLALLTSAKTTVNRFRSKPFQLTFGDLPKYKGKSPHTVFYTNYLTIQNKKSYLFYTYFPNKKSDKLVIFLSGGPGCSSMIAAFGILGPLSIDEHENVQDRSNSWYTQASLLFIDNPMESGFSFGPKKDIPRTAETIISQLDDVLYTQFFNQDFPETKNLQIFAFGESYGGKYMLEMVKPERRLSSLIRGIGIGNGWVDPIRQERTYGPFGYAIGISNYVELLKVQNLYSKCVKLVEKGKFEEGEKKACEPEWYHLLQGGGQLNAYDYRLYEQYKFMDYIEGYMNTPEVHEKLGLLDEKTNNRPDGKHTRFNKCSKDVWDLLLIDFQKSYSNLLPDILKHKRVLIYNGQYDLRCPVIGTEEYLRVLPWHGKHIWNRLPHSVFYANDEVKGIFKQYSNLTQVVVYGGSHMAPRDQPEATAEMLKRFMTGEGMCAPKQPDAHPCYTYKCSSEKECSFHGSCKSGTCHCNSHFSGDDCSIFEKQDTFGRTYVFTGSIFGQGYNVYRFDIGENGMGKFDVQISLKKLPLDNLLLGKLHIHLHLGATFFENIVQDTIRKDFHYHSLQDSDSPSLTVNELNRQVSHSKLTIVVLNTVDTESKYEITIRTAVSGWKFEAYNAMLMFITLILVVTVVFLLFLCIGQSVYYAKSQKK